MEINELKYIKGRKSVGILIQNGRVVVRAPKGIPEKKLDEILRSKAGWIEKKVAEYNACAEKNRDIIDYTRFLYRGAVYSSFPEVMASAAEGAGISYTVLKRMYGARQNAEKAYKAVAAQILPELTFGMAVKHGLKCSGVKLIKSKARWGSCDNKGVISLNWRLILLPDGIAEYVILHELCHTVHLNHSREYWTLLSSEYPQYKNAKKYLKENNYIIKLF